MRLIFEFYKMEVMKIIEVKRIKIDYNLHIDRNINNNVYTTLPSHNQLKNI